MKLSEAAGIEISSGGDQFLSQEELDRQNKPKKSVKLSSLEGSETTGSMKLSEVGSDAKDSYDTKLSDQEEQDFQKWKQMYAPNDSGKDYDLRGAYRAGLKPGSNGHWPDTFKKPNHPTFSNESRYATGENAAKAGKWNGEQFIPPTTDNTLEEQLNETKKRLAAQQEVAYAKEAEIAKQEQLQNQPENWSSTRFKKEAPKPQTPEEQAVYDATVAKKEQEEERMTDELLPPDLKKDKVEISASPTLAGIPGSESIADFFRGSSELFTRYLGGQLRGATLGATDALPKNPVTREPIPDEILKKHPELKKFATSQAIGEMTGFIVPAAIVGSGLGAAGVIDAAANAFGTGAILGAIRETSSLIRENKNLSLPDIFKRVGDQAGSEALMFLAFEKGGEFSKRILPHLFKETKTVVEPLQKITIFPEDIQAFFQAGGDTTQVGQFLKGFGNLPEIFKAVRKTNKPYELIIPERVIKTIQDRPWFAGFKEAFNLEPAVPKTSVTVKGEKSFGPTEGAKTVDAEGSKTPKKPIKLSQIEQPVKEGVPAEKPPVIAGKQGKTTIEKPLSQQIVEKEGGTWLGITKGFKKKDGTVTADLIQFRAPSGTTLALTSDKFTAEAVAAKIADAEKLKKSQAKDEEIAKKEDEKNKINAKIDTGDGNLSGAIQRVRGVLKQAGIDPSMIDSMVKQGYDKESIKKWIEGVAGGKVDDIYSVRFNEDLSFIVEKKGVLSIPAEKKPVKLSQVEKRDFSKMSRSSEDFEVNPSKMKDLKKGYVSIMVGKKIYAAKIGSVVNGVTIYNHADLAEAKKIDFEKAIPGFIDKKGKFVHQYPPAIEVKVRGPVKYNEEKAAKNGDLRTLVKIYGGINKTASILKNFAPEEVRKLFPLFRKGGRAPDGLLKELKGQYPDLFKGYESDHELLRALIDGREAKVKPNIDQLIAEQEAKDAEIAEQTKLEGANEATVEEARRIAQREEQDERDAIMGEGSSGEVKEQGELFSSVEAKQRLDMDQELRTSIYEISSKFDARGRLRNEGTARGEINKILRRLKYAENREAIKKWAEEKGGEVAGTVVTLAERFALPSVKSEVEVAHGSENTKDANYKKAIDSTKKSVVKVGDKLKSVFQSPFAVKFKKYGGITFPNQKWDGDPASLAFAFKFLHSEVVENFYIGFLKDGAVQAVEWHSTGTTNEAAVHPYEMLGLADHLGADGYFLVHNHPSGYMKQSSEDVNITQKIDSVLTPQGIKFVGHVIVNDTEFVHISPDGEVEVLKHKEYAASHTVDALRKYREWSDGKQSFIRTPEAAFELAKGIQKGDNEGLLFVIDNANRVLNCFVFPKGQLSGADALMKVVVSRGNSVVAVNAGFLPDDYVKVKQELQKVGIRFLDNIEVVSENQYRSWSEHNAMDAGEKYGKGEVKDDPASFPEEPGSPDAPISENRPVRLERPSGVTGSVEAPKIISAMEELMRVLGGEVPIRRGRFNQHALGIFKVLPEVVRLLTANDLPTAAHEVFHAIEKLVYGWTKGGAWKKPLVSPEIQRELMDLGKALYGDRKPAGGYKREGFAEFGRLWLTDRAQAKVKAPKMTSWFENAFLKDLPDAAKQIEKISKMIDTWQKMGSVARAKASMVDAGSMKEKAKATKTQLQDFASMEKWIDMLEPINRMARQAEESLKRKLAPMEDPGFIATALRTTHDARTRVMVEEHMIDIAGNVVGSPLSDIRSIVRGRKDEFSIYLWAKRAEALWSDRKNGPRNPGLSMEDARQIIKELETPQFQLAAQKVYDWNDGVLNYAAQGSPTFKIAVEKIRANSSGYYVPLQRVFDELDSRMSKMGGSGSKAMAGSLSKRLKGSGRQIKDIFPQMIANARGMVKATHNRMVIDAMLRLSRVEGMGHLVEKVPKSKVPVQIMLDQVISQLRKAGVEVDGAEPGEMSSQEPSGEMLTFFTDAQHPSGKDLIVPIYENGRVTWYQFDPELFKALQSMEVYRLPQTGNIMDLVGRVFSTNAHIFRTMTTGMRASFSLMTNWMRDLPTFLIQTRSHAHPGKLLFSWMGKMGEGFIRATTGKTLPYTDLFIRLGGEMAQPLGQDISHTRRAARRLFEGKVTRVIDFRNWWDGLRDILQFPELATRTAELEMVAKDIGWRKGTPITLEQSLRLLTAIKQVTTDFSAGGEFAKTLNEIIPFFNAAIQGPRAGWRAYKRNPAKFIMTGLGALTSLMLVNWWKNKDKEWRKELNPREKYMFTWIETKINGRTELVRIPRPFELGQIFMSAPEALLDAWYEKDPQAVKDWFGVFMDASTPGLLPPIASETIAQAANQDMFWKTPIVSQSMERKPAAEQSNEYTSKVAVFLGNLFTKKDERGNFVNEGISPQRIDHAIRGLTGSGSMDLLRAVGLGGAKGSKEKEPADIPVLGVAFKRGGEFGTNPVSVSKLYDIREMLEKKQASTTNIETSRDRSMRLMIKDATQAVSALSFVRKNTDSVTARRAITKQTLSIAKDALQNYRDNNVNRFRFKQNRKMAQRQKKMVERWG